MKKLSKYFVLVLLAFLIVLLLIYRFSLNSKTDTRNSQYDRFEKQLLSETDPVRQKTLLEEIHNTVGPVDTFKLLTSTFGSINSLEGHGWVHIFGSLLFQKHGVEGMAYCDLVFDFGCFHGFFGEAIPQEGIGVINRADELCIQKFGKDVFGCQHGIGHGVLEYYGHDRINEALDACSTLQFKGKIFGCQDGVFMDYNFPLSENEDALLVSIRQFNGSRPYEPCDVVGDKYLDSCYYSYPQWAAAFFKKDYSKVVELCSGIENPDYRDVCLLGVGGAVFVDTNYNPSKTIAICKSFDMVSKVFCTTAAAWVAYAALADGKSEAEDMCSQLENDDIKYCLRNYNLYQIYGIDQSRVELISI